MQLLHQVLGWIHIASGALSLAIFWIPVVTRKGGRVHRMSGRWFAYAMYVIAISAFVMSVLVLLDPLAVRGGSFGVDASETAREIQANRFTATFLLMLSLLVYSSVRHGELALRSRTSRAPMRTVHHCLAMVTTLVVGVAVLGIGLVTSKWLLIIFALIAMGSASGMLRHTFRRHVASTAWRVEHLSGMIGAGIGAYTAFFAFGGRQFFGALLPGEWQIIPWLLAPAIGVPAIIYLTRRNQRRVEAASG